MTTENSARRAALSTIFEARIVRAVTVEGTIVVRTAA
jgi:hypothetical protein